MTTLLAASAGGHLQELYQLLPRFTGLDDDRLWFTFDTAQSRSLLAGENVVYTNMTNPRDVAGALRNTMSAVQVLRKARFANVVSTGATVAVSVLPLARAMGSTCHYIESATRLDGPSLSARLIRPVRGIHFYAQTEAWVRPPWVYRGSVLDGFSVSGPSADDATVAARPLRIVVTVGSMRYDFRSLVERVLAVAPPGTSFLWQTGATDVSDLGIEGRVSVPSAEFAAAMAAADVVVAHAGVGSAIVALNAGRWPILVPRRKVRNEHVDDHQLQIAIEISARGLGLAREVDELDTADLFDARAHRVESDLHPPPFELDV